ncbi:MAG: alpha-glucosidase [Lentisphaerae bacterium]|nr:MAG: alpha-glucosidase [Lentisphaerota bacterium]
MRFTALILAAGVLAAANLLAMPVAVQSLDGRIAVTFEVREATLFYSVLWDHKTVVAPSRIEIFPEATISVVSHSIREHDSVWKPVWGQFSSIRDHHRELTLSLTADGMPVTLQCRAFDAGIGFRFVLSEATKGKRLNFSSAYHLLDGQGFYFPRGERGVEGPVRYEELTRVSIPLVAEHGDGTVLALLESDLYSAAGFQSMLVERNQETGSLLASSSAVSSGSGHVTPWRVILMGETIGDLFVNTVTLNLAAPCKLDDVGWITPGKGLWDWRVHGYDNGDFVYGINTRSYLRFIDFCAAQGLEYFTVDDHWFESATDGRMTVSPDVDIERVMRHAREKGVRIILYYDRKKGDFGDDRLFSYYAGLGASGIKYGFMGNRADFTRAAIEAAAENKLLINFHDRPVPMAGVERTLPNLIAREYCHAQQDSRRAFTPETFLKMAMVNSLVGPLDMANGNFGINGINAGERQKGPRKPNSYISTVVSEVARCLVIYTGLVTLPDAPEEYLKKIDLFEFLKAMPVTWDDTRVLNAKIGQFITVARRSGDTWFVGSVNDQTARTLPIGLDFLEPGKTYKATLYQDAPNAHGLKNPEAYEIKTQTVRMGDVIPAWMAVGGGHAMILRPMK